MPSSSTAVETGCPADSHWSEPARRGLPARCETPWVLPTTSSDGQGQFDPAVFREVISNFMSGVVIVTARHDDTIQGMTVSAVSSLSLEPPMLVICLNRKARTQELVHRSGAFAINILSEEQGHLADQFASKHDDRFAGVPHHPGLTGAPVLDDVLGVVECRVEEDVTGGSHRVFLGRVVHAEAGAGSPLAYYRGKFGRFELAQDADAYRLLRDLVLERKADLAGVIDPGRLATALHLPMSAVHYALTRLSGDRLVARDPDRGYVVAPMSAELSDDVHDALLAIQLGAAELTVGRVDADRLTQFRRLAEATVVSPDGASDVAAYVRANDQFHDYLVQLAGIDALAEAYAGLSLPTLMTRALGTTADIDRQLGEDHVAIVDAYQAGDLAEAKRLIIEHSERAKSHQRAAIEERDRA
jgi:flavin reductase (DIM6/NTAB) family NADH-FMN oxidoreductase RutF/DNA-binding FadR family transcriptional regulator